MSEPSSSKRIVLVEDNPGDVFLIREALRVQGLTFELICYGDVPEAIDGLCDEQAPVPDIILLDWNLPKGEGIDVLRAIRSVPRLAAAPVAIVTSSNSPLDEERALRHRVNGYIHKAPNLADFLRQVGDAVLGLLNAPPAAEAAAVSANSGAADARSTLEQAGGPGH
jgi:CheY-like chemotaxis protein